MYIESSIDVFYELCSKAFLYVTSGSDHCLALMISTTVLSVSTFNFSKYQQRNPRASLTSRFQTRASNQKPINIFLLRQLLTVLITHTSPINDPRLLCRLLRDRVSKPFSYRRMYFLRLFCGCNFSCADGPDRFIGDDDFRPVFCF